MDKMKTNKTGKQVLGTIDIQEYMLNQHIKTKTTEMIQSVVQFEVAECLQGEVAKLMDKNTDVDWDDIVTDNASEHMEKYMKSREGQKKIIEIMRERVPDIVTDFFENDFDWQDFSDGLYRMIDRRVERLVQKKVGPIITKIANNTTKNILGDMNGKAKKRTTKKATKRA